MVLKIKIFFITILFFLGIIGYLLIFSEHKTSDKNILKDHPKMIILGFDGVEPKIIKKMIQQNKLPHISKLAKKGYLGELQTTNPPQSPVAWAAFATGATASKHRIFDFIGRDTKNYFPMISTHKIKPAQMEKNQIKPSIIKNLRRGKSFWDMIANHNVPVSTLNIPYAHTHKKDGAKRFAGLGTPDIRGLNSSFTLITNEQEYKNKKSPAGGQVVLLKKHDDTSFQGIIQGPKIIYEGKPKNVRLPIHIKKKKDTIEATISNKKYTMFLDEKSAYIKVIFSAPHKFNIVAFTRLTLIQLSPHIKIYMEPFSISPNDPYFPIANPKSWGEEIWEKWGPFKTVGWVHDTNALRANVMSETQFLKETRETLLKRSDITINMLQENSSKLLISVFTAQDRIGHLFYRYIDKNHPIYIKTGDNKFMDALHNSYIEMDTIIGKIYNLIEEKDILIIMSDHGFDSFRREFHINKWLAQEGYLIFKNHVKKPRNFFLDVDWSKTKAYALGTGGIFINMKAREKEGIVPFLEAKKLVLEISQKLRLLKDNNISAIREVFLAKDIFKVSFGDHEAPDIRIALKKGYRTSWETGLGGMGETLFSDNYDKWSGDHASAHPKDVPGFILTNKKVNRKNIKIEDISATAYHFFSIAKPDYSIGENFLKP